MKSQKAPAPALELRPRADRFFPDTLVRLRSGPGIVAIGIAALAGLAAVFAFSHGSLRIVGAVLVATVIAIIVAYAWFSASVLGTRWMLYSDRLEVRRPVANEMRVPLGDISEVRLESISGFGMHEPIYVFRDHNAHLIFWTVARRWSEDDLHGLWDRLGLRPIDSLCTVNDFETLPYDRRY
jgi:hypothetical protein